MRDPRARTFLLTTTVLLAALLALSSYALMAVRNPDVRIIRSNDNSELAVAFFTAYDPRVMADKTFCALGIRFEDNEAVGKTKIRVFDMKVVAAGSGEVLPGFDPRPRQTTTASFATEMEGLWFGFWGVFQKSYEARELVELRAELTVAPGTTDSELMEAFQSVYVGASESLEDGTLIPGESEHKEIKPIGSIVIYSAAAVVKRYGRRGSG